MMKGRNLLMNYGIYSILPSLAAIVLALVTKNVFIALFIALILGNFILNPNLVSVLVGTKDMMVDVFSSHSSTSIIFILLMLGGLFYLIEKAGGLKGFTHFMIAKRSVVKSRVGAELFTWLIGVLMFLDGTMSVMITGAIARPFTKAFKISPEKTAWIVHSTATPMSILIPIAAYGPYIASFIEAQGIADPTSVMVRSIGFNFYCIMAVVGVAVFTLLHIEYGPMKKVEEAYKNENDADESVLVGEVEHPGTGKARYLVVPLAIMIGFALVYFFTAGDSETGLILGIFFGSLYLMLDLAIQKVMKFGETLDIFFQGCGSMTGIVAIMVFAYALSNLLGELGTAEFLSGVLVQLISPTVFTALAFIVTCLLSFSTGTSAGSIAIMMPVLLPMALSLNVSIPLITGAIAGGAVFGDHTSPISDTTVMTCSSCDCDVVSHVKTQLPYALTFAAIAVVIYLVLGFVM